MKDGGVMRRCEMSTNHAYNAVVAPQMAGQQALDAASYEYPSTFMPVGEKDTGTRDGKIHQWFVNRFTTPSKALQEENPDSSRAKPVGRACDKVNWSVIFILISITIGFVSLVISVSALGVIKGTCQCNSRSAVQSPEGIPANCTHVVAASCELQDLCGTNLVPMNLGYVPSSFHCSISSQSSLMVGVGGERYTATLFNISGGYACQCSLGNSSTSVDTAILECNLMALRCTT